MLFESVARFCPVLKQKQAPLVSIKITVIEESVF